MESKQALIPNSLIIFFLLPSLISRCFNIEAQHFIDGYKKIDRTHYKYDVKFSLNYLTLMENAPSEEITEFLKEEIKTETNDEIRKKMSLIIEQK